MKRVSSSSESSSKRRHPTESGLSQRGLSWLDWLQDRPAPVRKIAMVAFVGLMLWMALARWGACLSVN